MGQSREYSLSNHVVVACTYCMGSKVSCLSQIYLYSSYFETGRLCTDVYSYAIDICGLWPTTSKAAKNGRRCTKGPPACLTWRGTEEIPQKCKKKIIGLHHPLDGVNNPKYKLLHFIQLTNILQRKEGTSF
jgi:hypothetical protein